MSETTASLWTIEAAEARLPLRPLLAALLIGALLGATLTALAAGPVREAIGPEPQEVTRTWPTRPLAPEWRSRPNPVDVDRMFRRR